MLPAAVGVAQHPVLHVCPAPAEEAHRAGAGAGGFQLPQPCFQSLLLLPQLPQPPLHRRHASIPNPRQIRGRQLCIATTKKHDFQASVCMDFFVLEGYLGCNEDSLLKLDW